MPGDIVGFRRINGHVVPIRSKQPKKDTGSAVKKIGAGIAIAGASGSVSASMERHAANYANSAFTLKKQAQKFKAGSPEFKHLMSTVKKNTSEANALGKNALNVRRGGALLGASLVGAGVHSELNKRTKLNEGEKATVSTAAGIGAYAATRTGHNVSFIPKGFSSETGKKVRRGAKELAGALKFAIKRTMARGFKL